MIWRSGGEDSWPDPGQQQTAEGSQLDLGQQERVISLIWAGGQ